MRDHAHEAMTLSRERVRADLDSDRLLSLALVRLLEIVGEAAAGIPPEDRVRYPSIPWTAVVGMRNRLVHGYDSVDLDIVWQIITVDLQPLVEELERILTL